MNRKVQFSCFSDILCVWAYVAQIRLDELKVEIGEKIDIHYHFITLFGCTEQRIGQGWAERGGFEGFGNHVLEVCKGFPHVDVNPDIWKTCRPKSSAVSHLFLKAVQNLEHNGVMATDPRNTGSTRSPFEELVWTVRCSFFEKGVDVGTMSNLLEIAEQMNLPIADIEEQLNNGSAMSALCSDMQQKETHKLEGSPTYLLNKGRQKLYGNVGYRILEANIVELLDQPGDGVSWC